MKNTIVNHVAPYASTKYGSAPGICLVVGAVCMVQHGAAWCSVNVLCEGALFTTRQHSSTHQAVDKQWQRHIHSNLPCHSKECITVARTRKKGGQGGEERVSYRTGWRSLMGEAALQDEHRRACHGGPTENNNSFVFVAFAVCRSSVPDLHDPNKLVKLARRSITSSTQVQQ